MQDLLPRGGTKNRQNYCEVCFAAQHRKCSRETHTSKPLTGKKDKKGNDGSSTGEGAGEPVREKPSASRVG